MAYNKESVCFEYQRGRCARGRKCYYRHDEQGIVKPAERHVRPSMHSRHGDQVLQPTQQQWQQAEPLDFVHNSKGVPYPIIPDPFKESRVGLAQAVKSMQKSTIVKAMWISYIQDHAASTRQYFEDFQISHDPQEYDEHVLLNFVLQFQQQPADDPDVVTHIIEREVQGETKTLKEEFAFTTELRVSVQTKAQHDLLEAKMKDLLNNAPEDLPMQLWQTSVNRYVIQPWGSGNINPFL